MSIGQNLGAKTLTTRYGIALQVLGDAAEHLATRQAYFEATTEAQVEEEAVRILLRRSREVFDEYAQAFEVRRSGPKWFARTTGRC